ncbi:unnamed protein product [Laminaria digitata]
MVTSSIMIGGEEHSVEAMNSDGTSLVLAQTYGGPQVRRRRPVQGQGVVATGLVVQSPWGAFSSSLSEACRYRDDTDTDNSEVDDDSGGDNPVGDGVMGQGVSGIGPESVDPAHGESLARGESLAHGESLAREDAGGRSAAAELDSGGNEDRRNGGETGEDREAGDDVDPAGIVPVPAVSESSPDWDRAWRPGGVRIFAKLKAVFDGHGENAPASLSDDELGDPFCKGWTGGEREERSDEEEDDDPSGYDSSDIPPSWASYQVVARARLGLPATSVACHPRMNFVLVGLTDGTIVVVLPGGGRKRGSRKATR